MKIVKGDSVYLRSGKDSANAKDRKSVRGKVLRVMPKEGKVIVEGLNMVTKHQKPRATGGAAALQQGGRIEMPAPIPMSRVMLICPNCDKPTRVGVSVREEMINDKAKTVRVRVCKQCGQDMIKPTDR